MDIGFNKKDRVVVFFDSGIGGLNLMRECVLRAPEIHYYYISDNANVPYGNKSADEICDMTFNALKGVEDLNPSALVIACNTVTADCIERIRQKFPFPVIGIQPAVKQAATVGGTCLVLATEATINSDAYKKLAAKFSGLNIINYASKHLASFAEEHIFNLPEILPEGLLPNVRADSVVLGCTHYVYLKSQIGRKYNCAIFDGIAGTAQNLVKTIGTDVHGYPPSGTNDHFCPKKLKITFIGQNIQKNKLVFENYFHLKS